MLYRQDKFCLQSKDAKEESMKQAQLSYYTASLITIVDTCCDKQASLTACCCQTLA